MKTTLKRAFFAAALAVAITAGGTASAQQNNSNPAFAAAVVVPAIFFAAEGATMTGYLATQSLNFNIFNFGPSGWGGVANEVHHGWKVVDVDFYKYNRKIYTEVDLTKKKQAQTGSGNQGLYTVGCIAGSAIGLIGASVHKGGGLKFYHAWEWERMTQAQRTPNPLTPSQAGWIAGTCGLAAFVYQSL